MMRNEFIILVLSILSFLLIFVYRKIAFKFKILDNPNFRSSHTIQTVRGGGIVFPIIWVLSFFITDYQLPFMVFGLLLISFLGFWDDMWPISASIRLFVQFLAFLLLWYQLVGTSRWDLWLLPIAIVSIGALNAVNFMDGINGITGLYALSILIPLQICFAPDILTLTPMLFLIVAILVFGMFNFRKHALCFAGDVGSLSLGYILLFYILSLVFGKDFMKMQSIASFEFNFSYVLLFCLYGIDVILTLFQRLIARQRLFSSHREHLYQILVNERKLPHVLVSSIYAVIQFSINIWVLWFTPTFIQALSSIGLLTISYILLKFNLKKFT